MHRYLKNLKNVIICIQCTFQLEITENALQTHHVYFTLQRRGNNGFQIVLTWNTRGVFIGTPLNFEKVDLGFPLGQKQPQEAFWEKKCS